MALKISLLGAGSVVFAKTLLSDVLQFPELSEATIALMDIDPARLKVAHAMAEKIIAKLGVLARVESTLDQREAIRGANYVIVTVQVGGYEPGTVLDFEIPRKYGLLQTIGDTLGIGGVFRGLRTIPVINSFARDIADVGAPGCLLLNYTNPMAMNCWAVDRAVGIPHVGLCHSVQGTSQQLANAARLPMEDITYLVAGINHMAFFLRFEYKRQDAYPILFSLLEDANFTSEKVRFEMMRRTGYFVTESSEHQSEYVPYFIHHGQEMIERFDVPIDEYLRRCKSIMATWKATEATLVGGDGEITVNAQSHEYGSYIIHSRETDTARVVYGNVPNRGLITNLPEGCCVEVPCLVNAMGLQPTHVGALPPQLAALCQTNINVQSLTVEAALTGRREHIYHAAMLDPHTSASLPLDRIWAMCDELIAAHQKAGLLGEFKPAIRNTGRAYEGTGDRILARVEPAPNSALDDDTTDFDLQIRVTNPGPRGVEVPLAAHCSNGASVVGDNVWKIRVEPGETVTRALKIHRNGANGDSVSANGHPREIRVDLGSDLPGVFAKGMSVRPRVTYDLTRGKAEPFTVTLAGFPAVEGTLAVVDGTFTLACDVEDSKIKPALEQPWTGSCVELFFDSEGDARRRQIFLVPQPSGAAGQTGCVRAVDSQGSIVEGISASYQPGPAGYRLHASIPLAAVGLDPAAASFLFDALFSITALGEAHSGGRAGLGGTLDSWSTSDHYARIKQTA